MAVRARRPTPPEGPITIWYSNNEQEVAWGKKMVAAWNSANPDQTITGQEIPAGKSSEEVIGAAITAGTAPCLIFNTAPSAVGQFQRQGGLVDLSTFPDGNGYIEARSGEVAAQYKSPGGRLLPAALEVQPGDDLLQQGDPGQGRASPAPRSCRRYDEFLAAATPDQVEQGRASTPSGRRPSSEFFQTQFDFMPLFAAETKGQSLVVDGKATFGDQAGPRRRDLLEDAVRRGAGRQGDTTTATPSPTAKPRWPSSARGPWRSTRARWTGARCRCRPRPASPAAETWTFGDAKNVGLYTACQNQGTAWEVLKFATSEEQDSALLTTTGQMPLRKDCADRLRRLLHQEPGLQDSSATRPRG